MGMEAGSVMATAPAIITDMENITDFATIPPPVSVTVTGTTAVMAAVQKSSVRYYWAV
jgi:hypothetical protein